jgi:hypothetical protein
MTIISKRSKEMDMAFGINRAELLLWKNKVSSGEIAYLTHYWVEPRFPGIRTITKVGCADMERLIEWCRRWDIHPGYIHRREAYPHFDLMGPKQKEILQAEGEWEQIRRFGL